MNVIPLDEARRIADRAIRRERERQRAAHDECLQLARQALPQVSDDDDRYLLLGHIDAHTGCIEDLDALLASTPAAGSNPTASTAVRFPRAASPRETT